MMVAVESGKIMEELSGKIEDEVKCVVCRETVRTQDATAVRTEDTGRRLWMCGSCFTRGTE